MSTNAAQPVAFHDKDQPNGIAWCPGYPDKLADIAPLYAAPQPSEQPVYWARADGEGCCTPKDKLWMEQAHGRWPEVAKMYAVPLYAAPQPAQEGQALSDEQIEGVARELFCKGLDDKEGAWGPNTLNQQWLKEIAIPFARALLAASLTSKKD